MAYKGFFTRRHEPEGHPLKYYRIVRKFFAFQSGLKEWELEILMLLDDEYFTKARFKEACLTTTWHKERFELLEANGWIKWWNTDKKGNQAKIFKPDVKAHRLVSRIYRVLAGREELPSSGRRNKLENRSEEKLSYSEKILRKAIRLMWDDRERNKYKN